MPVHTRCFTHPAAGGRDLAVIIWAWATSFGNGNVPPPAAGSGAATAAMYQLNVRGVWDDCFTYNPPPAPSPAPYHVDQPHNYPPGPGHPHLGHPHREIRWDPSVTVDGARFEAQFQLHCNVGIPAYVHSEVVTLMPAGEPPASDSALFTPT